MSKKNSSFDIEIPDEYHLLIMMAIIHKFGVRRFITHFIHVIYTYIDKIDQISRCFASAHTNSEYAVGNVKGKQLITGANAPVINPYEGNINSRFFIGIHGVSPLIIFTVIMIYTDGIVIFDTISK